MELELQNRQPWLLLQMHSIPDGGVVCDGVTNSGLWSSEEQAMHINWLELSAILFGVKYFVHSHNCLIKVFLWQ